MTVSVAIGKKATTIKKQTLLQIKIDGETFEFIFLIIPYLASKLILGNDFNLSIGLIINYWHRSIQIKNKIINSSVTLFEPSSLERLRLPKKDDQTCIYIIKYDEKESNDENINEVIENESQIPQYNYIMNEIENNLHYKMCSIDMIEDINKEIAEGNEKYDIEEYLNENDKLIINACSIIEKKNQPDISEQLGSLAGNLTRLDEEKRNVFISMLSQFENLFSDKPGCVMNYIHKLKLKSPNPIINQSYAVPYALRDEVEININKMIEAKIIEPSVSP